MPSDRNLLSLNASLAIPTRVLRFEASQRQQSGWSYRPHGRLDRPRWYNRPSWVVEPVWRPHLLVESLTSVLWLNRVTQWFSGEPLQTPQNWCSLRQSPLMARLPRSPSSTLVLRLNQETVHDFILPSLPPCGPHLYSPHLEASPVTTFRACSSPAPTPVKPQSAPAILSQESVHTTLSITHHTRNRPSTGPRTTHAYQSPPWWVNWQPTWFVTKEKRKKKRIKRTSTSDRKQKKGKEQDHL
jgi:hypothetical protein